MILQREPKDPVISMFLLKDVIAQRYGWTFEYIDSLDVVTLGYIKGVLSAESRYQKRKEMEMKMK